MTDKTHSNYLAVRPEWLARRHEEPIDPNLPIVDAHHHLWDRPGWRYLFDEYLADIAGCGHNITASVFMQCQAMYRADGPEALRVVGETEFVNGVAAMSASGRYGLTKICAGIVGHANLLIGEQVAGVLESHLKAGGGRFRGIRHITVWDADTTLINPLSAGPPGLLRDTTFRAGFSRLAPLNLSFDAWLFHPQISELTDLARAFPQTTIILNHAGGVVGIGAYAGRRDEVFKNWSRAIRDLARCENVNVKLGGTRHAHQWLRLRGRGSPARVRTTRNGVAALHRNLHRSVRHYALHVRKQLPGRQGFVRIRPRVERFQTLDTRCDQG